MDEDPKPHESHADRRQFLGRASTLAMAGGLALSYGTCGVLAAKYLFPAPSDDAARWQFVVRTKSMKAGDSLRYRSPVGEQITIARAALDSENSTTDGFIALSSTCPHLGCQVHWQSSRARFFCPCHNGAFDAQGVATEGPPAEAGQSLPRHPLRIENGLLYIRTPLTGIASLEGAGSAPGQGLG